MRQARVEIGRTLGGRFEIVELLGQGGMSLVYRATDLKHDRPAAVKVLNAGLARTDEFQQRFEREASLAQHAFHPNILPIWDSGEDGGVFYIAMPLARTDLGALIDAGTLETEKTLAIFEQIAWALDSAHARGIVHRDVKPENILLTDNPDGSYHAWLADFGVAKAGFSKTLTSDQIPFSAPYASPEQIQGRADLDGSSDQYSLACTLFETLTGHVPFDFPTQRETLGAHLTDFPPQITERRPDLSAGLDLVIARAMDKRPSARFGDCAELITEVRAALQAGTAPAPGASEPEPERAPQPGQSSRRPIWAGPLEDAAPDTTYVEPRAPQPVSDDTIVERPAVPRRPDPEPAPAPAPEPVAVAAGGGGGSGKKPLVPILGAVAGVAVLAIAAVVLLGGSDPKPLTAANVKAGWSKSLECEPIDREDIVDVNKQLKVKMDAGFNCEDRFENNLQYFLTKDPKALTADLVRKGNTFEFKQVDCPGSPGKGAASCVTQGTGEDKDFGVLWADGRFSNLLVYAAIPADRKGTLEKSITFARKAGTLREPA